MAVMRKERDPTERLPSNRSGSLLPSVAVSAAAREGGRIGRAYIFEMAFA